MEVCARTLSTLAIAAYLAAAVLPCEPPPWLSLGRSDAHAMVAPPLQDADPHSHHAAPSTSDVAPSSDGGHAAHAGHHADHDIRSDSPSGVSSRSPTTVATAELKPKCLCGCSETRSQVGGGTARLGRVIPGVFVPRLIEPPAVLAAEYVSASFDEIHRDLDPIPI